MVRKAHATAHGMGMKEEATKRLRGQLLYVSSHFIKPAHSNISFYE